MTPIGKSLVACTPVDSANGHFAASVSLARFEEASAAHVDQALERQLTATVHGTPEDLTAYAWLVSILEGKAGRVIVNGFPTGVEVCASMQHGGPYPATTDSRSTSVGTAAIHRFARPVAYQGFSQSLLPAELHDANPRGIWRLVDGEMTKSAL
jgi:NADP-dependent aldehyde dehydrogenase